MVVPGGDIPGAEATRSLGARLLWTGRFAVRRLSQPRFPFRSPAAIERMQRRRVGAMIHYAYGQVPYYRETMDRLGLRESLGRDVDVRVEYVEDLPRGPSAKVQTVMALPPEGAGR